MPSFIAIALKLKTQYWKKNVGREGGPNNE